MAEKTLFDYSQLTTPASGDAIGIVDISDLTHGANGTTKWIRRSDFLKVGSELQAWSAALDIWAGKTAPSGTVVGHTDTQALTNKTMDYNSNTFQNFPVSSTDGWTVSGDTWVYASASTFTIAGVDRTSIYTKGTRLKFSNTGTKYAVVVSSSFSTNTTVTIAVNTDYTIANLPITNPYYSYQVSPQGYPTTFAYTPTFGGFTATIPTGYTARFSVVGTVCTLQYYGGTAGTSNATTFTITAPITSKNISSNYITICRVMDAGSSSIAGSLFLAGNSTTINMEKTVGSSASWTNSGNKDAYFGLVYEI